jgi:prevent-host-death family protein
LVRRRPKTESVKASEARQNWSKLLNKVYGGDVRLLVEKDGIPVAGIVSAADLERFALLEAEHERSFAVIDEIREAFRDVPEEELDQEIERAVAAARLELRAERQAARNE